LYQISSADPAGPEILPELFKSENQPNLCEIEIETINATNDNAHFDMMGNKIKKMAQ
jgi:hypothetical protein